MPAASSPVEVVVTVDEAHLPQLAQIADKLAAKGLTIGASLAGLFAYDLPLDYYSTLATQFAGVTAEQALAHPTWAMGPVVTVNSSTMVNKGLEVMEARWLFGVEMDQIQVVVQPQSVIHSMVQYEDGAIIAQLGTPDMKLPIQYALYYPERRFLPGDRLDFTKLKEITFDEPDMETFRGLKLAYEAGKAGGSLPTVFNAANELAVSLFLEKKIPYLAITDLIQGAMENHKRKAAPNVDQILAAEQEAYDFIRETLRKERI